MLGNVNAVHAFLDEFSFPWRDSMAELTARYGIVRHPVYDWDVILIDEGTVPFPSMLFPIHANAHRVTSEYPSDYYSTHVWISDDPLENLHAAEAFVTRHLGPALPASYGVADEYAREWVSGPAAVSLRAFPAGPRPYPVVNPAHERDPRLRTACSVSIYPGYRPPLSEPERIWIRTARPLLRLCGERPARSWQELDSARPSVLDVEFARDPVPECERLLGALSLSGDGEGVVVCGNGLLVVPVAHVLRVEVDKLFPARGPGGSTVRLVCTDPHSGSGEKRIGLSSGRRPDELDGFAARLGSWIACPVVFGDPIPDA